MDFIYLHQRTEVAASGSTLKGCPYNQLVTGVIVI